MYQRSKFELQNHQYIQNPHHDNNKMLWKQCKTIIKELQQELSMSVSRQTKLNEINQQLELQLKLCKSKSEEFQQLTMQAKNNSQIHENKLKESEQKVGKLTVHNQQLLKTIKTLQMKHQQREKDITHHQQMSCKFQELINEKSQKISTMNQTIQLLMQQNRQLKMNLFHQEQQHQWDIQQLKNFNEELKNKYSIMNQNYDNYWQNDDVCLTAEYAEKIKRSKMKNQRKIMTPETLMTNFNGNVSNCRKKYQENCGSQRKRIQPFMTISNPQFGEQLKNIKSQITQQYDLINMKQQKFSRQRVNSTLKQLKKQISKIAQTTQRNNQSDQSLIMQQF